jgi:hypothetical protein
LIRSEFLRRKFLRGVTRAQLSELGTRAGFLSFPAAFPQNRFPVFERALKGRISPREEDQDRFCARLAAIFFAPFVH